MVIKIGKLRIDFESRTSKHRAYLFDQIVALREEIIDIVGADWIKSKKNSENRSTKLEIGLETRKIRRKTQKIGRKLGKSVEHLKFC